MSIPKRFRLTLLAILLSLTTAVNCAAAQGLQGTATSDPAVKAAVKLPDPLTQEAVRDLISTLDDSQVRKLLIEQLRKQADARAKELAARDERSVPQLLAGYALSLSDSLRDSIVRLPSIPAVFGNSIEQFDAKRGDTSYLVFGLGLVLAIAGGLAAIWAVKGLTAHRERALLTASPRNLWQKLGFIFERLLLHVAHIIVFVVVSFAINFMINGSNATDRYTVGSVIEAIAWIGLAVAITRFILAPQYRELRLCPLDDQTARFVTWRVGVVAAVASLGFGILTWMLQFGMTFGESRFGTWVNLAMHVLIISTIWQARDGITNMLRDGAAGDGAKHRLATSWPYISIGLVGAHWLLVEVVIATGNVTAGILPVMMTTLAVLISLPILEHGLRALVHSAAPINPDAPAPLQAAHRETQRGMVRCGRILTGLALLFGLLKLWKVDLFSLAQQGVGARFASQLIDISFIALIAYGLWEFVRITTDRQLAIERAASGIDPSSEQMSDGEGGKGETRLATILPLVRITALITIAVLAGLAIISELGVNITPLLAGAGIIGLAIGFGAQTLVKDIISGLFFLIDDAFRKGEYIDIGNVKGTVEKISVRSMQLRHHNGPLNTVPFGEIGFVTNFSRDWVVMKLPLRLTYDTDAEKVRKMIKQLGQEMLQDPVLGPQFLQPLKSQGVIQMEDSAMIMRVKFMTRPGDQWVIRRTVFAKIRELFEKNGIKFAHREVTVRVADPEKPGELSERERKAVTAASRAVIDAEPAGAPVDDR